MSSVPFDRRSVLTLAGAGVLVGGLAACGSGEVVKAEPSQRDDTRELMPRTAKSRLLEGNARFVAGGSLHPDQALSRRQELAKAQHPFAAVLSCADSRVPPELVFDQGLGDLFVVRSAGQVIDHSVMGSIQYGVEHLGVRLVVVLGHEGCGAVKSTIEAVTTKAKGSGTDIDVLVAAIAPVVKKLAKSVTDDSKLLPLAVAANVDQIVGQLERNKLLKELADSGEVQILGAVYDLGTGKVGFRAAV